MKIVTNYVYPPIPIRQFDWSAIDDDTYDGAEDSHCPIGYGATEQAAIDDLLDQMNDGCLTDAEQEAQALRCSCRGSDDYCVCQNVPDDTTKAERRSVSFSQAQSRGGATRSFEADSRDREMSPHTQKSAGDKIDGGG